MKLPLSNIILHIVFAGLATISIIAAITLIVLAAFSIVTWGWAIGASAVAVVFFIAAVVNFAVLAKRQVKEFNRFSL